MVLQELEILACQQENYNMTYLTLLELSAYLNKTSEDARRFINDNNLTAIRVGGKLNAIKEEVDAILNQ